MGAQLGNTRLAGQAAAQQRAAASEGIQRRRAALQTFEQGGGSNPAVIGEDANISPNAFARQEAFAAGPNQTTPFEQAGVQFAPGLEATPSMGRRGGRPGRIGDELGDKGSPAYEQAMQRIRSMGPMNNPNSRR
jgi:hypothetical protein